MQKKHIAVLMGGVSMEHEISMATGVKIADTLDGGKYRVTPVKISKDGRWTFSDGPMLSVFDAVAELRLREVDCVFIALHGPSGEDGRLQGMLDILNIPYTSSGCAASALAMDKLRCKSVVAGGGIRVAGHVIVTYEEWAEDPEGVLDTVDDRIGYPCVVKPVCQGSSVGMTIPKMRQALKEGLPQALALDGMALVEEFIEGREVTCGVLDVDPAGQPKALPVTEIRPLSSSFFDYHAKYTPGASEEITPADLPDEVTSEIQSVAEWAHELVGCRIWSRHDMIVSPEEGPVWIEVNTIPGMTPTSLYPQAAAAAGIPFAQLMDLFVEAALAGKQMNGNSRWR